MQNNKVSNANQSLKVLIVDDEYPGCVRMSQLLKPYSEIEVVGIAHRVSQAETFLKNNNVDLVFLDIEMPGENGIQFLKRSLKKPLVIYVTAYTQHALSAFDVGAIDYLVKPVEEARLYHAICRAKQILPAYYGHGYRYGSEQNPVEAPAPKKHQSSLIHLKVSDKKSEIIVSPSEIAWVRGMQNYTLVQLVNQPDELSVRKTMKFWNQQLDSSTHPRLDKSTIIQISLIKQLTVGNNQKTQVLFEGISSPLFVGKAGSSRLKVIFDNWLKTAS